MSAKDEEIDLFDLSVESSDSGTETNVFSIEYDPSAGKIQMPLSVAPQPKPSISPASGDIPTSALDQDIEDFSPKAPAGIDFGSFGDDDFDDDVPKKQGITQKIACVIGGLFGGKPKNIDDDFDGADVNGAWGASDDDFSDLDSLPDADDPTDLPYIPGDDDFSDLESLPDASSSIFSITNAPVNDAFDLSAIASDDESAFVAAHAQAVADDDAAVFEAAEGGYETAVVEKIGSESDDVSDFELTTAASPEEEPEFETITIPAVKSDPLPPPVFNRIAHICLNVTDLEKSVSYYEKLGFARKFSFNRNGSVFGAYLEFGNGNFIELFEDSGINPNQPVGRLGHFCLETDDIDAVMKSLDSRGIEYTPKKLGCDGTYQIWLSDPDGNKFEIHQYTPDSSQIVGRDVEADW